MWAHWGAWVFTPCCVDWTTWAELTNDWGRDRGSAEQHIDDRNLGSEMSAISSTESQNSSDVQLLEIKKVYSHAMSTASSQELSTKKGKPCSRPYTELEFSKNVTDLLITNRASGFLKREASICLERTSIRADLFLPDTRCCIRPRAIREAAGNPKGERILTVLDRFPIASLYWLAFLYVTYPDISIDFGMLVSL